jgi:hypothetical protein
MSDCLGSPATVWREKYSSYPTYKEGETYKINGNYIKKLQLLDYRNGV